MVAVLHPLPSSATLRAILVAALLLSCTVLSEVSAKPGNNTIKNKYMKLFQQQQKESNAIGSNFYVDTTICRTIPGLTKAQIDVCNQQPDVTAVALQGLQQAVKECQYQFQHNRWNCSSLANKAKNPYTSGILQRGFKETAFIHAMSSAGVVLSVAKACSQGTVMNCGCDTRKYKSKGVRTFPDTSTEFKWGGCSHNVRYGMYFSKLFLDARESGTDFRSKINRHNNKVGRLVVNSNMQMRCKCHGMSGSCELKTCWRAVPDMRSIGKMIKDKYKSAVFKDQPNIGNVDFKQYKKMNLKNNQPMRLTMRQAPREPKRKSNSAHKLQYFQKSPSFCERNDSLDISGTVGRHCNQTSEGPEGCSTLCCGRGYNLVRQRRTERCQCKFHWCCEVECQTCHIEEWISVCK